MNFLIENAKRAQITLSKYVVIAPLNISNLKIVGGVDVSYKKDFGCASAVAYNIQQDNVVTYTIYCDKVSIPYIPGFLAFREAPLIIKALNKILSKTRLDVLFVNGHGLAHPRKFGIASHIGVVFNMPSIGVAKNLLYGEIIAYGDKKAIVVNGNVVGYVITNNNHKIYVTIGHKVTAEEAMELVLKTWKKAYALPEPIRLADEISRKEVRRLAAKL
ncbi:endonuclease V [Ignisphaera sp. 4213-co]|uniref:Endonuclease V n=1 Tax=Ignisphaera cupida TaxID=3050454 RepID=A0ABD4Z942_9CREN|nr:endonuclease V [Ignisphaera sp. 4213-co]MDK6029088.1 endonuclease V [Ignisphaera sp. 4213-co]